MTPTSGCRPWPSRSAPWRSTAAWPSGILGTTAVTDFPEKWTDLAKSSASATRATPSVVILPIIVLAIMFVRAAALHARSVAVSSTSA